MIANLPNPRQAAREVNALLGQAAAGLPGQAGRVAVADLRSGGPSSWRGRLAADHFHPNDAGYASLAAAFAVPALARLAGTAPARG